MFRKLASLSLLVALSLPGMVFADELTQMIQQDLTTLGYDAGEANGEATMKTIVAISKFQSEKNLEVTGEVTPQLVGIVKAEITKQNGSGSVASVPVAAAASSPADLQAAQQACIQRKVEKAQKSQKKKRGFGSLMRAVSRTASQLGKNDVAGDIAETSSDLYDVNATAADLESAAKDLGISEDDIEACRNP
jgi:peptidoglycan hydrolase-like protein with peptidoglycan-binding domain